jgi:hypothetical protein
MRTRIALLVSIAGVTSVALGGPPTEFLTEAQALEEVGLVEEALRRVHPGLSRYTPTGETDARFARLREVARGGATDAELFLEIASLVGSIRCEHTKAEQPKPIAAWRDTHASHFPLRFAMLENRGIVTAVDPAQADRGVAVGDEILSVNGVSLASMFVVVAPFISVDGWTDSVKDCSFAADGDLMGTAFDEYTPYVFGWPDRFDIEIVRPGGDRGRASLGPISFEQWQRLGTSDDAVRRDFAEGHSFEMLPDGVGFLRVDTFVNYRRPVDPAEVFTPIFERLRAEGARRLILDLRSCGGGSDDVPATLLRFFADVPGGYLVKMLTRMNTFDGLREHLSTWDESVLTAPKELFTPDSGGFYSVPIEVVSPGSGRDRAALQPVFEGELVVLTSEGNASGATLFLSRLRQLRPDAKLIGEKTGGSATGPTAGVLVFLNLPHSQITVRIPVLRPILNTPGLEDGYGVSPDIEVVPTVEDFHADRDRVLELARTVEF